LKYAVRDRWIGWDFRHQHDRLHLIANNSRFLILPDWHHPNLASRTLSPCEKRLPRDWQERFGHPLLVLETFVDPQRFQGTLYRVANGLYLGDTKAFAAFVRAKARFLTHRNGSSSSPCTPMRKRCCLGLSSTPPVVPEPPKIMLTADQMRSLPEFFTHIPDPHRAQGRRHRLATVLALAAGAIRCGKRGDRGISDWAHSLTPKARERFQSQTSL
jgi:hypothetical protein